MDTPATDLVPHLEAFRGFVRRRVADAEIADDIVQDSLLKAVRSAPELREADALLPWFYRILRNAVTDAYRRRASESAGKDSLAAEADRAWVAEDEAQACACLYGVLDSMRPEYAQLIRRMDLEDAGSEHMAEQLGITRNNLKVRHHRARQQLRQRLEETCRTCATHGCLDCDCQ